ncbi:MAG: HAMP domain-containing histidine kinase [Bdellovibrionaceae bacterium]|nr:HAMP domain-containing histidine kinase [Pseudobdellovibrionaceae bacterium]
MKFNNSKPLTNHIRNLFKKQFLILSMALCLIIGPIIFWSINNFYFRSNRYLIESSLSYIKHLLVIGDITELQNHINGLVKQSNLIKLEIIESDTNKNLLSSNIINMKSLVLVNNHVILSIPEQNIDYKINYTYPYPVFDSFFYFFTALLIIILFGLVATNLIRNTSKIIDDSFMYLSHIFNEFKNEGLNLKPIDIRKEHPLEVIQIIDTLNSNIKQLREAENNKLLLAETKAFNNIAKQVAHDIRSPLTSLEILAAKLKDQPIADKNLIKNSIKRIKEISEDLLQKDRNNLNKYKISHTNNQTSIQIKQNEIVNNIEPIVISDLIYKIIEEKKVEYSIKKNINFLVNTDDSLNNILCRIDYKNFSRAISNLINNSVEAIEESKSGFISIYSSLEDDCILIELRDSGKGISPENMESILVNGVSLGKVNGNGIGLSFAKQVIESFNGIFKINSKLNVGTTISIFLPRLDSV